MNKPIFLDTGYVLTLLNSRDEFHDQALQLADEIDSQLITTEAILTEVGNALAKPLWRELAVNALNELRDDEGVEILSVSPDLFSKASKFYSSRMDKEWGLTDCISFIVMEEKKLTDALTTDHHFEQAGFKALLRSATK
ncbi:MAG: PIN domain-containing protein [Candidatus Thiosymbion ectosymbiont of Robbea hypermnestra]|nr:PIN domain-containing protein [Candidatus Thiosymbion ectosymbiont of Robbea hypermnestra]